MDQDSSRDVQRVLTGFRPVWQRVTAPPPPGPGPGFGPPPGRRPGPPPPPPPPPPPVETLRRLYEQEVLDAACAFRLAARFMGRTGAILQAQAQRGMQRAGRLAGQLRARGAAIPRRPACHPVRDPIRALRALADQDLEAAAQYRAEAERAPDPRLSRMLAAFADARAGAADRKRALLRQIGR